MSNSMCMSVRERGGVFWFAYELDLDWAAVSRARAMSFARVARMECGHSLGPLAWATPRAILSSRLEGGIEPLKGVKRCAGSASKVYIDASVFH